MDLETLIILVLKVSIVLTVFGFALHATIDDALYLFRRPSELFRSIMSMNIIMALFAVSLSSSFGLHPAVKIALVALALSPVPPFLPKKELKAGGHASYAIGLLAAAALLSIIIVPLTVKLLGMAYGRDYYVSPAVIAKLVFISVLIPLAVGIAVQYFSPNFADRISGLISKVAVILLVVGILPILFTSWPSIVSLVGDGTILAIAAFSLMGVLTGHLLGGPEPDHRTVLALSTASRHPGVALAIATANFPKEKLALAAILLHVLINAVVLMLYLIWRRRHQPGFAGAIKT
ncbi:MAG: Na+-dependent transporter [Acidobacteria bacterium]|nr:Na+-dependent transporter [Acidobacteriota bacterium]